MIRKITLLFICCILCSIQIFAQDGLPDPSFANAGFQQSNFGKGQAVGYEMTRLSTGKFLVGGGIQTASTMESAVMRFNANGTVDNSFGINGTTVVNVSSDKDSVIGMKELPDGKILVLSSGMSMTGPMEVELFRLKDNGTVDSSFGTNGIVRYASSAPGMAINPFQMEVMPDGSILVVVFSISGNLIPNIVKFTPNGAVDNTFGANGLYKQPTNTNVFYYQSGFGRMHLQADNSIILYWVHKSSTAPDSIHMEKVLPNGTIDLSYGPKGNGTLRRQITTMPHIMAAGGTLSDGSLLFVLESTDGGATNETVLYRVNADGTPVNTFGTAGTSFPITIYSKYKLRRVTALPNGEAMITGSMSDASDQNVMVHHVTANGQMSNIGNLGNISLGNNTLRETGGQTLLNADGSFFVVGSAGDPANSGLMSIYLWKLNAAGTLDNSFGTAGLSKINTVRNNTDGFALAMQPDGKIVVGGTSFKGQTKGNAVGRFNVNGDIDLSFGNQGFVYFEIGVQNDVSEVMIMPDGKIMVAGNFFNSSYTPNFYLARLNADGTRDLSYGTNGFAYPGTKSFGIRHAKLLPDGSVLIGSTALGKINIYKVLPNGTLDNSFGTAGESIFVFGRDSQFFNYFSLQSDGKILIAGQARTGMDAYYAVARLNPDGSLDNSFNGTGMRTWQLYAPSNDAKFIAQLPDGKLVVGGQSSTPANSNAQYSITRLNEDGSTDMSYGTNGYTLFSAGVTSQVNRGLLLPDNRVALSGMSMNNGKINLSMVAFNADGTVYSTFGNTSGMYTNTNNANFKALAYQPSKKRIIGIGSLTAGGIGDLLLGGFHYTPVTLPLTWGTFNVQKKGTAAEIRWTTLQEINTKDFVIQHLAGKGQWTNIATIAASGNSAATRYYDHIHNNPARGINQYRILQRDIDGRNSLSAIKLISFDETPQKLVLLNTMVTDGSLRVQAIRGSQENIRLINNYGQLIAEQKATGNMQIFNTSQLSSGVYYVVFEKEVRKVIIRK